MLKKMLVLFSVSLMVAGTAVAQADEGKMDDVSPAVQNLEGSSDAKDENKEIPSQVTSEHWAYKEVAALVEKFGTEKKLPEGKPCPKDEMIDCFVAALNKIVERYDKEGSQAVSRDDLESIRALIVALEADLFKIDGYRQIRRTIEQLLVQVEPPGVPYYRYKVGVNGFLRGEGQSNFRIPDASYTPGQSEGRFLYRVKPFVYWHPNQYLDIHLEGQGYGYTGGNQYQGKYSLYQGFVEAKLPREDVPGKNWVALKAGRQEFNYGSAFILGADTFFNGLSFDAVRLRVQPQLPWLNFLTVDFLGGRYATPFSDGIKGNLAGAYVTYEPAEDNTLQAYAFRDTGSEDHRSGERLDTLGFRSTSSVGMFGLEYELAYQTGRVFNSTTGVNDKISAYGGHVDLTGEFKVGNYDNSIFMSYAMGSGDKNAANGVSSGREFRNPNNDSSLVGDMSVVGDLSGLDVGDHHASGIQVYTLGWGIDVPVGTATQRKLNFSATGRKFMAGSVEDGFSRDLGVETDFTLTYIHNKDLALIVGYDRFFTGKFFRDASGSDRDIDYGYAMLVFNYDWTRRIPLKR
ncbi:alginate export family protein [Geobacter sp.]|uniref:alginate export family protein n=1 Tax=Geobacter sp. TaxID=46610 RepID=UPI0026051B4C|nr:alginate export family protein [Geobacter sp.]